MKYSALTRQLFESAPNAGELDGASAGRGSAGSIEQGIWVQFDVQPSVAGIAAARFQAFACPHTIAVAAWIASSATQFALVPTLPHTAQALQHRFGVPVEKLGRILLVEDAWCAAIRAAITKSKPG